MEAGSGAGYVRLVLTAFKTPLSPGPLNPDSKKCDGSKY